MWTEMYSVSRGVDYAWAERFQMPEPPKNWEGIQDALDYGYGCPEMSYSLKGKKPEGASLWCLRDSGASVSIVRI